MNKHKETLMKFISAQNQKIQDDISKQGYKDNSPYRDNPFNIIQGTPQGTSITMDDVSKRLYATDGKTSKILEPNSGTHFFSGSAVKETALAKYGGLLNKTITCSNCGWSWKAADGGNDVSICHKCGAENKIMQEGGPTSDIKSWFTQHMQSPVYRKNLESSGYKDIDAEIANRLSNIDKTKYVVDENRLGTYYNPRSRYIHHAPLKDVEHWEGDAPESESILAHEFGHSGVAKGSGTRLNKYDIEQLGSRNKNKKSYPWENYADQKALQYEAAKLGIYNPDTEEFTQEHLNKLKNTGHKSRALENYSDEDLIWLINNIAQVNNQSQLPIAQDGRELNYWRPVLQNGGNVLPDDYGQFIKFNESLPDNLRDDEFVYGDPNQYDLYGMWESVGKPASFKDVKDTEHFLLQDDGYYHGFSVNPRTGQFLKPKGHGTIGFEVLIHALTPGSGKNRFLIENEKGRLQYINKEKNGGQFQNGGSKYSYPLRDKLYPGEDEYFKAHPEVGGMAAEDNQVIINPYSPLSNEEKNAIRMNETARLAMRNGYARPTFDLTSEQKEAFKNYSSDEQDQRETIIGRILSGDPSAKNVTPEQKKYAEELQRVLKFQAGGESMYTVSGDQPLIIPSQGSYPFDYNKNLPVNEAGMPYITDTDGKKILLSSARKVPTKDEFGNNLPMAQIRENQTMWNMQKDAYSPKQRDFNIWKNNPENTQQGFYNRSEYDKIVKKLNSLPTVGQEGLESMNKKSKSSAVEGPSILSKLNPFKEIPGCIYTNEDKSGQKKFTGGLVKYQNAGKVKEETYIIPESELQEVVVKPSEFSKYRIAQKKAKSWEEFANERYLGNFEKNMGQTVNNLPAYRKQEYEDYINKLAFDEYVRTHPAFKGEKRGAYIDRIQKLNEDNQVFERAYDANAEYNPSTDVNIWRKGLMGLGSLVMGAPAINKLKQKSDYFSTKEKQHIDEHPIASAFDTTLGTLAPLEIPGNMLYGKNNTWDEALSGRGTDVPMEARILGDPAMLAFEAAPLLGAGFKTAGRLLGTEEGLLSNTYKINPRAFKPNPESFYRQIGNEGLADAVSSNTIRSANQSVFPRPHFVEGSDFTKLYSTGEGATGSRPSVIFETSGLNHVGEPFVFPANSNSGYTPWIAGDAIVPLSEGRILQKDWLQGYKPVQFPTSSVNVVENVTQKVSPTEWQLQKLPGLHLKSTMSDGAVSKIVEPKTGLVNVEQALAIIGKESSGSDKVGLIKQALGENIPKKMDYNQFRKIVQDQLIPLEQQFSIKRSDFGIESIGYTPKVQGTAFDKFSAFMNTPLSELFGKPKLLENKTIIFGNANKFGIGSSAHGNPEETLGHIHFLIDSKTPNTLTVTQIQSDAFQGTHRMMPKNIEDAMIKLEDAKGFKKHVYETFGDDPEKWKDVLDKADKTLNLEENHIKNFMQKSLLDKNHQERYIQELVDYAGKRGDINKVRLPTSETAVKIQNYTKDSQYELESKLANLEYRFSNSRDGIIIYNDNKGGRYIKDADGNYLYKREFGNSNSKTISEDEFNNAVKSANDEIARLKESLKNHTPDYTEKQKTILKKYSEQPKIIKKLFGQDVKIVKDSKGNTWYEFDIPETFKQGQGEIQAFNQGGELPKAQFGSPFGLPVASTIANKIVSWFSDDEKKPVVRPVPVERTFHIKDPRTIRATTQQPIRPTADLLSGTYNSVPLDKTLREAKRRGLSKNDMWNLAGMALAETGLGNKSSNIGQVVAAPFEEGTPGPYEFVDAYINKMKEADKLGIKDPVMRLQVYNGLGPITPNTEKNIRGYKMQKAYGVPLPKEGISMKKRPLYGINVLDAQNNVLKKNPEFVRYIDSIYKAPVYKQGGITRTKQEDPLSWFMS